MPGPERRQSPRTTLETFAYINLGANNYGSVLNISASGLCFRSVTPVLRNRTVHFWFSEHNHRIEAMGEVTWTNETQKTGGLRFTNLSEEAREQIRHWIANPTVPLPAPEVPLVVPPPPIPLAVHPAEPVGGAVSSRFVTPIEARVRIPAPLSGFSAGLALGLLIAFFVAAAFLFQTYRRELGESLIRMGERFAARSAAASQSTTATQSPAVVADLIPGAPQPATLTVAQTAPAKLSVPPPKTDKPALPSENASKPVPTQPQEAKLVEAKATVEPKPEPAKSESKQPPATPSAVNEAPTKKSEAAAAVPISPTPAAGTLPVHSRAEVPVLVASKIEPPPVPAAHAAPRTEVSREEAPESKPGPPPQMFFEVGKFKDSLGARKTKEQLAQLGFHSSVMQKNRLWMNSYLVLVGPYNSDQQAQAASQVLQSRDFEPRPFERGTRSVVLRSGVKLNGTSMPDGNCTVSWESYATNTLVKIEQDHFLVTKATGKWVPTENKFRRDAFVYRKNGDGSRTLLEIQFSGLNKTLVFGDS